MSDDLRQVLDFERNVKLGDVVRARWRGRHAPARVLKINDKSYRVELLEEVSGYPVGHQLTLPRFSSTGWTWHDRIGSLDEPIRRVARPAEPASPPKPLPQPLPPRPPPASRGYVKPATKEELFVLFNEAAQTVWGTSAPFALAGTVLLQEAPKDEVFASLTWHGGRAQVIGDFILRRPVRYELRIADRLLTEPPDIRKRIMIHEAVHLGIGNHGIAFRTIVRRHGGAVSEKQSGEDGVDVQRKIGARYKTIATFLTEEEAQAWAKNEKKNVPGSYRLFQ